MWRRALVFGQTTSVVGLVVHCDRRKQKQKEEERRGTLLAENLCILERQHTNRPLVHISLEELLDEVASPRLRLVLFGETHTDQAAQELERVLYERMTCRGRRVALGLESIETDKRDAVRDFVSDELADVAELFRIREDATRYGPLVCLAKASRNAIVAANAPRRLVSTVSRNGAAALDSLPPDDLALLPPLRVYAATPITRAYHERLRDVWPTGSEERRSRLVAAQCLWDTAMAYAALDHLRAHPAEAIMLVLGRFHVEYYLGVCDQVEHMLDTDAAFSDVDLERDEFRILVCIPLTEATFRDQAKRGWHDLRHDRSLANLADFVVFTRCASSTDQEIDVADHHHDVSLLL
ncbi:hypothetical protein CTAYLR_005318 [Chrysophaeum taylorii]|uniref:Haem-binding uptake Tiki superfamily ChaN domain-containing protein n=1 Tax=Chrysophaeum taylorii TaxID=2483200 RepID=A0AAD7UL57_9STRA|nr:hypothetical protein CTAYLR_005318 [Chrysophaeum taylorii]